jgi:hypothetical protein
MESVRSFLFGSPAPIKTSTTPVANITPEPIKDIHQDDGSVGSFITDPDILPDGPEKSFLVDTDISPVIQHILFELLHDSAYPGPIYKVFDFLGYSEPFHFIIMTPHNISIQSGEEIKKLTLCHHDITKILSLQDYYYHLLDFYNVPILDDIQWLNISYQDLVSHQLQSAKNRHTSTYGSPFSAHGPSNTHTPSHPPPSPMFSPPIIAPPTNDPSHPETMHRSIRSSVKKDPNAYPEYKEDRFYNSWILSVSAMANLHGTNLPLDSTYVPTSSWDQMLFDYQQAFM